MARPTDSELKTTAVATRTGGTAPAPKNEAFEKEVDEELQREWFQHIWNRYSSLILAGAVAIVLAVGGYKIFEQRKQAAAESQGARYFAAIKQLTEGKTEAAQAELASLGAGGSGYAVLSRLQPGELVTFLVYDLGQEGSTRSVTLQVGS